MNQELISITDFIMILYRRRLTLILVFVAVMIGAVAYLLTADRWYKLTGTIYTARFQQILMEEGEFVAAKLRDFSFMTRALEKADVELDMPISRLRKLVTTEVVNEVKKNMDVGLVQLTVEYKDAQTTHDIFKALTDLLIEEHKIEYEAMANNLRKMEEEFRTEQTELRGLMELDETAIAQVNKTGEISEEPYYLMLSHTVGERRTMVKELIKEIYYLRNEVSSATKSFNTRLASPPRVPDEHFKPKRTLVVLLGGLLATLLGTLAALGHHFYDVELRPRLKQG